MKKTILIFGAFFLTSCVDFKVEPNKFNSNWKHREIVYETVSETYTYPFEILLPLEAEIIFDYGNYATVIYQINNETDFFFEIRPANGYSTIAKEIESYCDEREKIRNTEIIPLKTFSDYKTYKALLSCTTGNNYLVELNNGKYFYFTMFPKSRENTEPVLQHILNNLKITTPAIQ